jgi:nucleoid-associated protein YgaU
MADLTQVQQAVQGASSVGGVRNLSARQNGNVIEIHGEADNIAAKQNAIKAITAKAGDKGLVNMIQVAQEPGRQMSPQPSGGQDLGPTVAGQRRTHLVKKGETLSHLAQKYYGKGSEYKKIFDANRDQLSDPDKIREGQTLQIP